MATHWLLEELEAEADDRLIFKGKYDEWYLRFSCSPDAADPWCYTVTAEHSSGAAYAFQDRGWEGPERAATDLLSTIKERYPHLAILSPTEKAEVVESMQAELDNIDTPSYVDPPCDAPETNPTVQEVLDQMWWVPIPVRDHVTTRLNFGLEKYEKPLRTGWSKADQYLREEEGDMVAYLVAGGYTTYATILSWQIFFRRLWVERFDNPLNAGKN